jgi:hypothetical protein
MTATPGQLTLDLAHRPALGAEDFLVSRSNQAACDVVDRWPDWPSRSVLVVAPPGAGKTHLANVWRLRSGAAAFAASALCEKDVTHASSALLVEDLHAGIGDEAIFDFDMLELQKVNADHYEGWNVAPGMISFSHPGYQTGSQKTAIMDIAGAKEFSLINALTGARMRVVTGISSAQRAAMLLSGDIDIRMGSPFETQAA